MATTLDKPTFDTAWLAIRAAIVRYAARRSSPQDAEDRACEAYLTALCILDRFETEPTLPNITRWLTRITAYVCLNSRRQTARRREVLMPTDQVHQLTEAAAHTTHPSDDAQQDEEAEHRRLLLHHQIACLHHRRREIWQHYRQGKRQTEIAAALGITQQAVSYHIDRIIDELRANAGNLITRRNDGYRSAEEMFQDVSRVTIYHAPTRRGSAISAARLRRLK